MYALSHAEHAPERSSALYLAACTSVGSDERARVLAEGVAALLWVAHETGELQPLRELLRAVRNWNLDVQEIFTAAGHDVVDTYTECSAAEQIQIIKNLARIERMVLGPVVVAAEDTLAAAR